MINLAVYAHKKICVAVSGGRDSMALLHYFYTNAEKYGITVSALNCNHKMRKEASDNDSLFVKKWCSEHKIPLLYFEWNDVGAKSEASAREWRRQCYSAAVKRGVDAVATAHHLNDNAETVLFNLARGSALSGMTGITDGPDLIRPFISLTRERIDGYIEENGIPFVDDSTNFTDDYTRNKIRHNVLPELEKAVPEAATAFYRFSRLAAEDEEYFNKLIDELNLIKITSDGAEISFCEEKVIFRRAAVRVVKERFNKKDYTFNHIERLFALQFCENGKRFEFLNLTVYKEEGKLVFVNKTEDFNGEILLGEYLSDNFSGHKFVLCGEGEEYRPDAGDKVLRFDMEKIPETAVIRFPRAGDRFTKFGGGSKKLGDYFTDKKISVRLRGGIPLIADGNDVLVVGGVEISEKVKITSDSNKIINLICSAATGR